MIGWLAGTLLATVVGLWALARSGESSLIPAAPGLGLLLLLPPTLALLLAGLPLPLAIGGAAGSLVLLFGRPTTDAPPLGLRRPPLVAALPALACLLVAAKTATTPLWSWDHFAIWGLKSRHLFSAGRLDPSLLADPAWAPSIPEYPLGVPTLWRMLALGGEPRPQVVLLAHLLLAVALVAAVWLGARQLGLSAGGAAALATLATLAPVLWDTESLGLADVALATAAVAAWVLLRTRAAGAGALLLGTLPWVKTEGAPLALLLVVAAGWRARWDRRLLGLAVGVGGLGVVLHRLCLPSGPGFLAGDWLGRLTARLASPTVVLEPLAAEMLRGDGHGLWWILPAALGLGLARRRGPALRLGAVVIGQIVLYIGLYFATVHDPTDHVRSSWLRVLAALAPLALLAVAASLAPETTAGRAPGRDVPTEPRTERA